jgi:tetratricopeptide (TPR) repeat protein
MKIVKPLAVWCIICAVIGMIACMQSSQQKSAATDIPPLHVRKDTSNAVEWNAAKQYFTAYSNAIKKDTLDHMSRLKLVEVYINEARITGDQTYYNDAAMKMLNYIISKNPANKDYTYLALNYKSTVLLSMHQFEEAKKAAVQTVNLNPYGAGIYGALVDADVELGKYDSAVMMADKMMSIRPDIRSYSRVSYLRQIYGDNDGAIAAMRLAIEAGLPGAENTEWARVTCGDIYLNTGHPDTASMLYQIALEYRPNYAFAEMGLAKAFRAEKKYDEAMQHCKNAIRLLSESSFVSFLADLYELKGDTDKAKEVRNDVLNLLLEGEKNQPADAAIKHNANRELATAYLNNHDLDKALEFANNDLAMRPENIDANDLTGWIYYLKGDFKNAKIHAEKTFKTNSRNASQLYKAGLIFIASGDAAKGNELKTKALAINKNIDPLILKYEKGI